MGSRVFPTNFQLATPFLFQLRVRHGTDRRSDRQQPPTHYAPPFGDGHRSLKLSTSHVVCRDVRTLPPAVVTDNKKI